MIYDFLAQVCLKIKLLETIFLEVKNLNKKESKSRKILIISGIMLFLWIFGFYLYITYSNIQIDDSKYEATKVKSTINVQSVEKEEAKSNTIANIIEKTTQSVVGISKLKNMGSSLFSKNTENELGLGTGFIVSSDGYILSNEHVTGTKYSRCYVTLENGNNYEGTVVWSDSDLDLSI